MKDMHEIQSFNLLLMNFQTQVDLIGTVAESLLAKVLLMNRTIMIRGSIYGFPNASL